jgi:hypothetical protein
MKHLITEWLIGGGGALVISAAARALPEPQKNGNLLYLWFYRFCHALLANFDKANQPPV